MANLLSTNVSGRLYTSGHVDTAITNAAFRFYDGTTFRGGLGLDDWAHGGSSNDLTLYVANNGSLFITTNSIKRHFFNSGEAAFRTYAPDLNYKISVTGGDQLNAYYGSGAATLYLQYHGASGGALNVANGKLTVNTAGSVVASGDMRAPVFYDSADTSYYVDPNSYSRIYRTSTHIAPSPGVGSSNWVNDFNATPTSSMSFGGDLSSGGPQGTWWFQQNFRHSNSSNYWGTQVAWGWEDNANELWQRNVTGGSWSGWVRYINTNNYTGILDSRYQQSSTAITTSNIGSQSVSYASSAGSVAWNNVTSKPSLDYQQDYVFTAPNSTDGSGYSWVRVSMGGFNAGGDFVRFSISRAIFWNGSSPYGGPSMDVVAYSREWHGGQEGAVITYAEHGSVPGNGWVTNAGPRDLAGGGYWFYMRIWGGVDYAMRVYRGCGPIGTNWEETSDPGSIFKVKLGVNNIGAQHTGFNTNGQVRGDIYYDYNDEGYYGDFNGRSVLNSLQLGTASSDTTNLKLDVQGNMAIRGANGLYFGVSTNNFNSWSTRIYASGSTQYFNAQTFIFDNQGYGSSTFVVINSSGVTINGNTAIHSGNIGSQSVSYATTSGTSAATAQTNFASLTVGGLDVATREYVTSQGYLTSLPSHNHDDRYYTETEINSITHQWEWRWIRRAGYLGPASGSATDWTNYYLSYFTERTNATEGSYPEQASGYINTITNVDSSGGFGGSTYGNIFGDLDSYHCLIYTNIFVEKEFRVTVSNFNGDDPHAIFIDGVFVHGNTGCCVDTSYIYTFKPGWHRIDLIYSEGGGGDFIRMGWNPKDYTGNIKDMTPHRAGENPRNILDKIKSLVVQSDQSVRAPIFYDSADTSYYIDPNATSRIDRLQVVSNWGGSTPNDGQINIRGMYPSMTFRNTVSNSMWLRHMDGDGHVQHYFATGGVDSVNWGIKHTMFNDGTFFSSGSMRSPIFYDSNDTTYYLDPASNATSLNVRGVIRNPSIWINDGDDYNSYNENIRLFDAPNGVSVIAFSATGTSGSPRTSILGFSDRLETRVADNWQQRIYNGYVEASGSFRAPIFYDSNDTNYFVDPNSISQLNYVLANNWFRPQGSTGLYFQTYGRGIWSADSAGASYGNVSIYGDGINSWPGYAINNLAIFMARDIRRGIFIPSADSWLIRYEQSSNMAFVDFELQWGSDIRYKSNIKRLTGALDTVKQLKGVTYNYKGNERTSIGFIAQEVEPVLPEVVSTDGDGFKSVGYANIVALLSEAIKEQQVMIEQLKARIDILESK